MKRLHRRLIAPVAVLLLLVPAPARTQPPDEPDAAELLLALRKLNVVGTGLYVAAHPDDENTAFLAWLSRERLVRSAYLSMTRGDGGQNLIGSEKGELMGLIRTQELLAARRIDKAEQFFSRAVDFGYSKSPEETLAIWDREKVLADAVWVIRRIRPDVIVTRFPVTGEGGHGHHTASALLAQEAFKAAADPKRFPEQLKDVEPWQAKRLLWNVFRFGANAPREDKPGQVSVDLGAFNTLLGKSYTEIAALSRSMHKSQGFGSAERRGTWLNDFQLRLGEPAQKDLFEGVDLTWNRIPGSQKVSALLEKAVKEFDATRPSKVVPLLAEAYGEMSKLPASPWVDVKKRELLEVLRGCGGLWVEAIASDYSAVPGGDVKIAATILNRSAVPMTLEKVEIPGQVDAGPQAKELAENQPVKADLVVKLRADSEVTNPYWLRRATGKGLFDVADQKLVGLPESAPALAVRFTVKVAGESIAFEAPVQFRWTDPVKGEEYRPFIVAPPVTLNFDEKVNYFGSASPRRLRAVLVANVANARGTLRFLVPQGWKAEPDLLTFSLKDRGDEQPVMVTITPRAAPSIGTLAATAEVDGKTFSWSVVRVDYPHIPIQTLFQPAEVKLVRADVKVGHRELGYVMGSGDEVPSVLKQLGYTVTLLSDEDLTSSDLKRFETIVLGVRAFNTRQRLKQTAKRLFDYVSEGGTLVTQYDTTSELVTEELGPYPFKLSRDRVTVEEAPVTFTKPGHPLLTTPNRIDAGDFADWVQERGLYFAGSWDPRYETPLSSHDPGESDKSGGLLYARHGKGVFVYTGYSFFRQLPAGVPGAARLFANLVSADGEKPKLPRAPKN